MGTIVEEPVGSGIDGHGISCTNRQCGSDRPNANTTWVGVAALVVARDYA